MGSFGHYETVREIHRTGLTVVYSGREAGSSVEEFAIKIFQPFSPHAEKEQEKTESDLFLNSARTQQKTAVANAQHWAPIYDCGLTSNGAFCVTDKYDRSLQQLIDGRIGLTAQALHGLVESISRGLIELKQACERPHGNLKATNVLIAGEGDISQTRIVLSDPLPDEHIDTRVHWNIDLRAIGDLIYQLIIHRPSPTMDGWQVPDSKEWARLGKQADDWRNLCNRLLNAHMKPETITVETLVEDLALLKKTKPIFSPRRLITAGLGVIACIVVLVIFWPKGPPPEKAEWENLCNEYLAWVGALYKDLGFSKSNERVERWGKHIDLKKIVEKIKKDASYPYKVLTNEYKNDISEIISEPLFAKKNKTQKALEAIKDIKNFFDPMADKAWPLLVEIQKAADNFEERRWQGSATYLKSLVEKVKPGQNEGEEIAKNVDTILELNQKGILKKIDSSIKEIDVHQETIEASGDPILARFGDYVQSELVSDEGQATPQDGLGEIYSKLEPISSLANELAEFIKGDWQTKVGQEAFLTDHGNDSAITLTSKTFNERLDIIKGYYYLRPDPRDKFFELVSQTGSNIKAASVPNPQAAGECAKSLAQLELNIEEIRNFTGIEKYRDEINNKVNDLQPEIAEINKIAISLIESPEDWLQRINGDVSIASSKAINENWIVLRDKVLKGHTPDELSRNNELYQELRQKVKDTKENLVKLDQELRRELPAQIDAELKEIGWNNKLKQLYDEQRSETIKRIVENIPLQDELPGINDLSFEEFRRAQFSRFKLRRDGLGGILTAFNEIQERLEACCLLDDRLPEKNETIRLLWDEWKAADILKEPRINETLEELTDRVKKLEEIEKSDDRQQLADIALGSGSQTEAAYAAWIRFGRLSAPPWPNKYEDLEKDREIQRRLEDEFKTITQENEQRGLSLLKTLVDTGLKREIAFKEASIGRYKNMIEESGSGEDVILTEFVKFATDRISSLKMQNENRRDVLDELADLEDLAKKLVDFLSGEDWQNNKINISLFQNESPLYKKTSLSNQDFENWLEEVKDYRKLDDDPRSEYSWDAKIDKIESTVNSELARKQTEEDFSKLQSSKSEFDTIKARIHDMLRLPAVEKYKKDIDECENYWSQLIRIENELKPPYCNRLDRSENGQVIFDTDSLNPKLFEPVNEDNKKPAELTAGWGDIRQGISQKRDKWLNYFYTTDLSDTKNVGWPKYVRSTKDQSVIFRFIPAGPGNLEPFYMATHEITNAQYKLFLTENAARGNRTATKWKFLGQSNNELISAGRYEHQARACKIEWDGASFSVTQGSGDVPVTWVTGDGARSYAQWFGAQLPTAPQHKYACRAGTNNIRLWGNDLSQIATYAHVRGGRWKDAVEEYNSKLNNVLARKSPPPVGAVKPEGFISQQTPIDVSKSVYENSIYNSAWPVAGAGKPNNWGLYDMIGNVWEWCINDGNNTQFVICGGSCLAPPEYVLLDDPSNYILELSDARCDVGFRIIVPAR